MGKVLVALLILAEVLLAGTGAYVHAERGNTLGANGRWISAKTRLEHAVMTANEFVWSWRSLRWGHLDLSAWHGFQDVLLREPIEPRSVDFRFRLGGDQRGGGHVSLEWDVTETGRAGIRLSVDDRFDDLFFTEDELGRYVDVKPVSPATLRRGSWSRLHAVFEREAVEVLLDGESLGRYPRSAAGPARVGFRGGFHSALVDDVRIRYGEPERVLEDRFFPLGKALSTFGLLLLPLLALHAALAFQARGRGWSERTRIRLSLLSIVTVGGGAAVLFALHHKDHGYPRIPAGQEEAWRRERAAHDTETIAATEVDPDAVRVLFVGSSQTAGSGASRVGEDLISVTEELLEAADPDRSWACLNGGIPGTRTDELLAAYQDEWLDELDPDLVVINLSSNDNNPPRFEANLETFARIDRERGIPTLFSLEANSIEKWPDELPLHALMRAVAERSGIPVVDPHAYLKARANTGPQWWDFVHPSSLGHRQIAEVLAPAILELAAELPER